MCVSQGLVFVLIVIRISLNTGVPDTQRQTLRHSVVEGQSCTSLNLPGPPQPVTVDMPHRFQPANAAALGRQIAITVSVSTTSDVESDVSSYRTSLSTALDQYSPGFKKVEQDAEKVRTSSGRLCVELRLT